MRFIDELAQLLLVRGMPYSSGRVYAFILLRQRPVSLDEIAEALRSSRVGAWNAARKLETFGHVQRHGVPGSKRVLYSPSDDFATPFLGQMTLMRDIAELLKDCARNIATKEAAVQLERRARFNESMCEAMDATIRAWNESQSGSE